MREDVEEARLAALKSLEILDTPPDREFDSLVQLAADICETPMSTVTLIDEDRQWFKAAVGMQVRETTRDISFCSHAIGDTKPFIVEDAQKDGRFSANPSVTGAPNLRFYAGIPLKEPGGYLVGTLCVMDVVPRTLTEEQQQMLEMLAWQVEAWIEHRFNEQRGLTASRPRSDQKVTPESREERSQETSLLMLSDQLQSLVHSSNYSIIEVDRFWVIRFANTKAVHTRGESVLGCDFWQVFAELRGSAAEERLRHCMTHREIVTYDMPMLGKQCWYKVSAQPAAEGISIFALHLSGEKPGGSRG